MSFLGLALLQEQQAEADGYVQGPSPELNDPNVNTQIAIGNPVVASDPPPPYYPGALTTPVLNLSLTNMGVNVAENMVVLDAMIPPITGAAFTGPITVPSMQVMGAATINSLSVISNMTLNGSLTDSDGHIGMSGLVLTSSNTGLVLWSNSLTFNTVYGESNDFIGTITITNPATTSAYVFSTPYTGDSAPIVVFQGTATDPTALGGIWVTYQGSSGNWTGFTINCTTTPASAYTFNYLVVGNSN